ncbi:uncharacterized protein TNCV_2572801 [Trichonephila clavipes]|nr:uncharacterized protein TNCV_2572801 [Trichonephila clavipes]
MTTCIPGNALQQFQVKNHDLHTEICYHLPSWLWNKQMPYFSSVSDEWSRDLKSVQVQKQLSCGDGDPYWCAPRGEEWYKPRDLGKQCDIFYASKGKSYDEPERAKWNDSEKRSFNGSWGKQPFGEKSGAPASVPEVLVEDVLLPPEVLDMLGGAQSEENSLAQSSQDLRVDSGNVDETEVSSGILPEKAQEHIEENITSCRNEVGTLGTKDEKVTAEMDKGITDSFRSEQECCAELALA